jgi:ribosomal protein L9
MPKTAAAKGPCTEATEGNIRNLEKLKAIQEANRQGAGGGQIAGGEVGTYGHHRYKFGEGWRLFGSITTKGHCEALEKQHKISSDKRNSLDNPLKHTGDYELDVK